MSFKNGAPKPNDASALNRQRRPLTVDPELDRLMKDGREFKSTLSKREYNKQRNRSLRALESTAAAEAAAKAAAKAERKRVLGAARQERFRDRRKAAAAEKQLSSSMSLSNRSI